VPVLADLAGSQPDADVERRGLLLGAESDETKCSAYYTLGHLPRKRFVVVITAWIA